MDLANISRSTSTVIYSHTSINGFSFGQSPDELIKVLGSADKSRELYSGEVELLYGDKIFRFLNFRFVECTIPDPGPVKLNGMSVLNIYEWLGSCADVIDRARFRISLSQGLAYDRRDPSAGSITVFEEFHWDGLIDHPTPTTLLG
ncbi:MAG: hypothetical protein EVA67_03240 [OM182 bacterium]|jgi:hypothetical protein|nr:MAG: hypothetical protein EVA67_03240 [OM182 bacterium]|tara:strand:+ start:324 stop:761 length:438 start_codon:yes stop_codon:yes gene_type:complete